MPLISVIIPTRNRVKFIKRAIESILENCTDSIQAEIIIVDDGSTDGTDSVVKAYPIKYICGPERGVSPARNVGLKDATGTYITFLDDDDAWPENTLARRIKFLEENPQYGAVCSQVVLTDEELTNYSPPYPIQPFKSGWMFQDFLSYIPQVGSLIVRREVIEAVGDFEETLQGGEDWDWALRIARHCQIGFIPEIGLLWRIHPTPRVDGAGNKRPEDIAWRRYKDVMLVAHRYAKSESLKSWIKNQRIILKHKGHYIPLFMEISIQYLQSGKFMHALSCGLIALRISPPHLATYFARSLRKGATT